jgi:hypothetical protein
VPILKSRTYSLVLSTLILVAALTASSINVVAPKPASKHSDSYESFVIQASGKAYDRSSHEWVDVTLWLSGSVRGKICKALTLHSKDGTVTIEGYGVADALRSNAVLIPRKHFARFMMLLTPQYYGGSKSVWIMCGKPCRAEDDTIPITLKAAKVVLPFQSHHMCARLYSLHLEGTIQLS